MRTDDMVWTDAEWEAKVGKDKIGDGNTAPWGWREITEKEFVQGKLNSYSPKVTEWRQLYRDMDGNKFDRYITVRMYWFHDGTGVAVESDFWAGKLKFYAFGCDHEYVSVSPEDCKKYTKMQHWGMHCRAERCVKCDDFYMVDTSG